MTIPAIIFMLALYAIGCFAIMMATVAKANYETGAAYASLIVAFILHGFIAYFLIAWAAQS